MLIAHGKELEKKAGIGVKSEVVYSPSSSVHGKCIETVAIRMEESDLKKINTRNLSYACILHKRKEDESVRMRFIERGQTRII